MTRPGIPTTCPDCRAALEVAADEAGRRVRCDACRGVFVAVADRPARRRRRPPPDNQATAALVLGILSVTIFCLWPVGLVTSGIGAACGYYGLRGKSRATAIAGLVLSIVGLVFASGFAVVTVAAVAKAVTDDGRGNPPARH